MDLILIKIEKKILIAFIEELIKESETSDYKLPLASKDVRGGIKTGYDQNGKNYPVQLNDTEQAYVSVPWTDNNTTYAAATTSTLGLVKKGAAVANAAVNAADAAIAASTIDNERYLERKQCAGQVQFVNDMWRTSYNQQKQRFEDRQTINQEMFGIYSAMRNGFDLINTNANKNAFDLYKYSRDNKDELVGHGQKYSFRS